MGSCLLLNVDGVPLVVTAAHILDQRASEALYIGGLPGSNPVHVVGGITMATPKRTFGPKGLSGGALIELGDFASPESYARDPTRNALLGGMLIEYHRDHHALVSIRIDQVINGIRIALARQSTDSGD